MEHEEARIQASLSIIEFYEQRILEEGLRPSFKKIMTGFLRKLVERHKQLFEKDYKHSLFEGPLVSDAPVSREAKRKFMIKYLLCTEKQLEEFDKLVFEVTGAGLNVEEPGPFESPSFSNVAEFAVDSV